MTFSTFVSHKISMDGRRELFRLADIWSYNMRIHRKATIHPQKGLLEGTLSNTQLFLFFETSRVFTTRKIGVPAQGWKTPRTYYARRRAENTAKASQRRSPLRVQVTLGSLGTHPVLLCWTEVTGRRATLHTVLRRNTGTAGLTFIVTKFRTCPWT